MQIENWFSIPIWKDSIEFDRKTVKEKCLRAQNSIPGRTKSNVGGWQSEDIALELMPEFTELYNKLKDCIAKVCISVGQDFNLEMGNCWININKRGDYNVKHFHPKSIFSGVLYVDVGEDPSPIVFYSNDCIIRDHYPVADLEKELDSSLFFTSATYIPKNGMVLIFPSWISHEVKPSNSDHLRISISFNIVR